MRPGTAIAAFTALVGALPAPADVTFVWADDFSAAEQARLIPLLRETDADLEKLVGQLPMGVTVRLHRQDDATVPCPGLTPTATAGRAWSST